MIFQVLLWQDPDVVQSILDAGLEIVDFINPAAALINGASAHSLDFDDNTQASRICSIQSLIWSRFIEKFYNWLRDRVCRCQGSVE